MLTSITRCPGLACSTRSSTPGLQASGLLTETTSLITPNRRSTLPIICLRLTLCKYSFHLFINLSLFYKNRIRNKLIWQFCAFFGSKSRDADNHGGLAGIQTHENGIHLYKSPEARYVTMRQLPDYALLGFLAGFLSGGPYCILALCAMGFQIPRKLSTMRHFTWHAELLPHTE